MTQFPAVSVQTATSRDVTLPMATVAANVTYADWLCVHSVLQIVSTWSLSVKVFKEMTGVESSGGFSLGVKVTR